MLMAIFVIQLHQFCNDLWMIFMLSFMLLLCCVLPYGYGPWLGEWALACVDQGLEH